MNKNYKTQLDPWYVEQQEAINEICTELNLVAYRPNYHADKTDKNTVIIYTKEGHQYNENNSINSVDDEKGRVCSFENSDINGKFDLDFMNHGKIDLRGLNPKEKIKDFIIIKLK